MHICINKLIFLPSSEMITRICFISLHRRFVLIDLLLSLQSPDKSLGDWIVEMVNLAFIRTF